MQATKTSDKSRLRREWSKEAIDLAMKGEWQRATEVNQALLTLYPDDADAKNRLGHAFIELAEYGRAREVLVDVVAKAPYNNIARKNLARLEQLENAPAETKQTRKSGGLSRLFIAESGKSGTTVLQRPAGSGTPASVAPGDPVTLVARNRALLAYGREEDYLGKVEARLSTRLARLIAGGNRYEAAVVGINDWGVSIIIRETHRHPSLHNISSFPANNRAEGRPLSARNVLNYLDGDDLDEDEEGAMEFIKIGDFDGEWDE
jgi:tetratricopeptide (TPR) repeat protein